MNQIRLRYTDAWQWILDGWALFIRNPGMWLAMTLVFVIAVFVLNMVPVLGPLAASFLSPVLLAGFLYGSREQSQGRELTVAHLFYVLQDSALTVKLLVLGLIPMVVSLLGAILIRAGLPPSTASFIVMGVALLAGFAMLYTLPLVVFEGREPVAALQLSLKTCLQNAPAVAVFLALALVFIILAAIPFGLGLLIYIPVMVCSVYASYNQVLKPSG